MRVEPAALELNLGRPRVDVPEPMDSRLANIKQLISESTYPIDEAAVAEAIIVRTAARRLVPEIAFRLQSSESEVRSFRPHRGAASFRLARAGRRGAREAVHRGAVAVH